MEFLPGKEVRFFCLTFFTPHENFMGKLSRGYTNLITIRFYQIRVHYDSFSDHWSQNNCPFNRMCFIWRDDYSRKTTKYWPIIEQNNRGCNEHPELSAWEIMGLGLQNIYLIKRKVGDSCLLKCPNTNIGRIHKWRGQLNIIVFVGVDRSSLLAWNFEQKFLLKWEKICIRMKG